MLIQFLFDQSAHIKCHLDFFLMFVYFIITLTPYFGGSQLGSNLDFGNCFSGEPVAGVKSG